MEKIKSRFVETYAVGDFRVDVFESEEHVGVLEAWLYHKDYTIKLFVFGLHPDYGDFAKIVEANIIDHIIEYKKEYMEGR